MHGLHHVIVGFARDHAVLACVLAGLLASVETLPVLGALVPGTATIVAIAALVPSGAIPFTPLAAAVALGAMLGDTLSYGIGRRFGPSLLTSWPLNRHPVLVKKAEEGVAKHGGKTLLVSRFTPGVRAIVPPLAGALGMTTGRFVPIIVAAGLLWALAHVALGVAIGAGLELLGAVAGRLALVVLVAGLLAWLTVRLGLALARRLPVLIARTASFLLAGLARGDNRFSRRLARVLDSPPRTVTALVLMALLLAGGAWLFGTALDMLHDPVLGAGAALRTALSLLRTRWSDPVLLALAATGNRWLLAAVALSVLAGLAWHRRSPTLWVAGLLGALLLDATMAGTRVLGAPGVAGLGAPAALAATLYGMLAYAVVRDVRPPWGRYCAVPISLVIVLAGFARAVLGLSVIAQEVAGIAFAIAWVGLSGVADILRHHDAEEAATPGPASHAASGVLVAFGMAVQLAGVALVVPPAPPSPGPPRVIDLATWRNGGWATLPAEQAPLLGSGHNPLVLQWAGSGRALAKQLDAAGWHRPVAWTPRTALGWLLPQSDAASLPVLPHLYRGEPDRMILIRAGANPDERLVLRLWVSRTEVAGPAGTYALHVGTLSRERLQRVFGVLTMARSTHAAETELGTLATAFPATAWVMAPSEHALAQRMLLAWPLAADAQK
jgi:membrane protein DedA with SNARE-associated domain